MSQTGIGVMLGFLGGNEETVRAVRAALGRTLSAVALEDDRLRLGLDGGETLVLYDDGQSCCESRYMQTDDDLASFVGAKIVDIEVADGPTDVNEYGEDHETQFLRIKTDRGTLTVCTHNEHNGYYGGFWIVARTEHQPREGAKP